MNNIEERLQKLEAANNRYKRIIIVMMAAFTIVFMAFRSNKIVPDVLQAKRFEVVDDKGNILVRLSQSDGNGTMKTFNTSGKKLVNLTYTTDNKGYLALEDGIGQETMRLSSSNDGGGGYIGVYNPSGKRTLTLCNDNSGGNI